MNEYRNDVVLIFLLDRAWIDREIIVALRKKINKFDILSTVDDETLKVTDQGVT